MKYFGYLPNDFINGEDVCVSFWTAGCPHKCVGCHNSDMWNYEDGYEVPADIIEQLIKAITANGIMRNFSILGGEPLSEVNIPLIEPIITSIRAAFPHIKIYLWTGYDLLTIQRMRKTSKQLNSILSNIDVLIDGKYEQELRDITLKLRGSANQKILYKGKDF